MISNTVFTIVVTNFFMKICKFFGGGETYTQRGFTLTILVYLVFYAAAAVLAFLLTRERIHNVSDSESRETEDTLTKQEKEKKETVHREAGSAVLDSNQISVYQQILDSMSGYVPGILFSNELCFQRRQYILRNM